MHGQGMLPVIRLWMIAICVIWIGAVGWLEFAGRENLAAYQAGVLAKSAANCSGTFKSRYACRSSILIGGDNALFVSWGKRFAVIFLPPLALFYLFWKYRRRREEKIAEAKRRTALKRKARERAQAQARVQA